MLIVFPTGNSQRLQREDFIIKPTSTWKSPQSGVTYPSRWSMEIPSHHLTFEVEPYINSQEHLHSFRYWEGAVKVQSKNTTGFGYAELTGYGEGD